jgi:hypothetical protein
MLGALTLVSMLEDVEWLQRASPLAFQLNLVPPMPSPT